MNDDELRSALSRRAASSLTPDERTNLIRAARIEATEPRRRSLAPRFAGWLAAGAAAIVLVVIALPVLLSPPRPAGPSHSPVARGTASPVPVPTAIPGTLTVYSAQELSNMIGDSAWVGKVVLAEARLDRVDAYGLCPPPDEPCFQTALHGVTGKQGVLVGWRDATAEDGVQFETGNGYRWVKQLAVPTDAGLFAFKVGEEQVEYLGPTATDGTGGPLSPVDLLGVSSTLPTDGVIAVRGWLQKDGLVPSCPAPHQLEESPRPALDFYCDATWLTQSRDLSENSAVRVQNDAYEFFAANPSEGRDGVDPQPGVYLVRNAGCPEAAPCPAWRVVGRLDSAPGPIASSRPPSAPPTPASVPIRTGPPATACDDALLTGVLVADPMWRLAIQASDGSLVPVVWPNGYSAQQQPNGAIALIDENGETRAVTGDAMHVGGGLTTDDAWGACGLVRLVPATPVPASAPTPAVATPNGTDAGRFDYADFDEARRTAEEYYGAGDLGFELRSYAAGELDSVVQLLFGPGSGDSAPRPPDTDDSTLVWGFIFVNASGASMQTVYVDLLTGAALYLDENTPRDFIEHRSDLVFDPPIIHVDNATSLDMALFVNGQAAGNFEAMSRSTTDARAFGDGPWHVVATTTGGHQLISFDFSPQTVYHTTGDYPVSTRGTGGREDLSCGRLDVWVGVQPMGPAPFGSYPPGDCDP